MSALVAAKVLYDAGDLATAKTQLQWAIDHGNAEYASLARVRLAGLLLDEKAYDQGLALLSATRRPRLPRCTRIAAVICWPPRKKRADARAAYQQAIDKLGGGDAAMRQIIQFKLDALGTA